MFGQYSPIGVILGLSENKSTPKFEALNHHFPPQNCRVWNFPISDNALAIASAYIPAASPPVPTRWCPPSYKLVYNPYYL